MPEVTFTVSLPDGTNHYCYSPSTVVKNYFTKGDTLAAATFAEVARKALTEASNRVVEKFGFSCTAASASLADIERWTAAIPPDTPLTITHI
ncbi:MSMEG_0570 family nitrogen starvation response protein [Luteolibacter sp. AS25]|uniref:MSMEG_0570 family nitrogen starvation response protein n=1 Tax=Luteolibacter sp. AS25 TaxID=3135776 RepID=UPI00398AD52B